LRILLGRDTLDLDEGGIGTGVAFSSFVVTTVLPLKFVFGRLGTIQKLILRTGTFKVGLIRNSQHHMTVTDCDTQNLNHPWVEYILVTVK
jgi:hypothetical protein